VIAERLDGICHERIRSASISLISAADLFNSKAESRLYPVTERIYSSTRVLHVLILSETRDIKVLCGTRCGRLDDDRSRLRHWCSRSLLSSGINYHRHLWLYDGRWIPNYLPYILFHSHPLQGRINHTGLSYTYRYGRRSTRLSCWASGTFIATQCCTRG
jgi:hypothetical protein